MRCDHKNIKKNYSHGKKSKPDMVCKKCGEIIKSKYLEKIRIERTKERRKRR